MRGQWGVDPAALDALDRPGSERTLLLAPFDVLLHDRKRMAALLGFDYATEMYNPRRSPAGATTPCPCSTVTGW